MIATAALPMTIPPIAPPERLDEWFVITGAGLGVELGVGLVVVLEDEDDDVVEVELALLEGVLSDGQACPGSSMKVEFLANCFCTARVSFAVGLMTPTMP
jgi:hypothetical protein